MAIEATRQQASCGALIRGVDLTKDLSSGEVAEIRAAWLKYQVVAFPDQPMEIADIERFAAYMGPNGEDPYLEAIAGHPRVVQVKREADEKTPIFAETWHSDWSFLKRPPAATVLYGNIIPPTGGDTLFSNQYAAWDGLSGSMRALLKGKMAIHSARKGYAKDGMYGERDKGRSMAIKYGDSALKTQLHPLARPHTETGRLALYVSPGYTIGIDGIPDDEAIPILKELYAHQARLEFVYRHKWVEGMLIIWDNRSVIHAATGGYEGHRRLLHRITVADRTLQ
ncbi:MAG: TauD/TfdA family dioxygenase [Betaproteobacteria bacterium]|nr:TauD/TfdA family dioxygenase [Betaproteobacteria bacterium]